MSPIRWACTSSEPHTPGGVGREGRRSDPAAFVFCYDDPMNEDDLRRIALSFDGAEESAHMGAADFRVGGSIFATLAHIGAGYGNLMLTPEAQRILIAGRPDAYLPVAGGWGRMGSTHVRLAEADEETLTEGLRIAWSLRVEKNRTAKKSRQAR